MPAIITPLEAIANRDELDHLRNVVATQERLLRAATRFLFGSFAAMNFYAGEADAEKRWVVCRLKLDQRVESYAARDIGRAEACELAQRLDAEEKT